MNEFLNNNLSKDSKVCYNFISKHIIPKNPQLCDIFNNINNTLFKNVQNILKSLKSSQTKKITKKESDIKKQMSLMTESLLYKSYKKYDFKKKTKMINILKKILNINDFRLFVMWYSLNQHKLGSLNNKVLNKVKFVNNHLKSMLYDNPFVSIDIQIMAESNDLKYTNYQTEKLNVHIFCNNDKQVSDVININEIVLIYELMSKISKKETPLTLTIFTCTITKTLKPIHGVLTSVCINSGSTMQGEFINIWRKEEWKKVLIHEMIHFFAMDIKNHYSNDIEQLQNNIHGIYNIKGSIIPYEAFTELLAIIIHSCYLQYIFNNKVKLKDLLCIELNFSLFQVAKILDSYGITNIRSIKEGTQKIKQTTSVFSYFIIKTAILFSFDRFIDFLGDSLHFDEKHSEFEELIITSLENKEFVDNINNILKIFKNKNNDFIWNTMRMSCLGVE